MVARGEVWLARLDPTEGREIRKTLPCLIISPPELHDYLDTVIAAPMTTGSRPAPFRRSIDFSEKSGFILLDRIRTLDKRRLARRLGAIGQRDLLAILTLLREMFSE